jgi:hypothetical protein
MPQFSDDLFLGPAQTYMGLKGGNPSPMDLGVGPLGRIYVWDSVPAAKGAANVAAASVWTAGITLTAGTGTTSVVRADGTTVIQLDQPRAVSVTLGSGSPTSRVVTVTGYDVYGQPMSEAITTGTTPSTTVNGKKAFYQVATATISGSPVVTVSLGTSDVVGLPVAVTSGSYLASVNYAGSFATDSGTFVAADATPATTTTGDVRGTYTPSSAFNGTNRLVVGILLTGIAVGPNATRAGALGTTQA